jgi:hypothetical protein
MPGACNPATLSQTGPGLPTAENIVNTAHHFRPGHLGISPAPRTAFAFMCSPGSVRAEPDQPAAPFRFSRGGWLLDLVIQLLACSARIVSVQIAEVSSPSATSTLERNSRVRGKLLTFNLQVIVKQFTTGGTVTVRLPHLIHPVSPAHSKEMRIRTIQVSEVPENCYLPSEGSKNTSE